MTTGVKAALTIMGVLLILAGGSAGWQTWQLSKAKTSITGLVKDVASARADAARWQVTAQTRLVSAEAQADLAADCIKREAEAQADATAIADIMAQAKPKDITPEQIRQGVDDATRQRAAAMLNRPW